MVKKITDDDLHSNKFGSFDNPGFVKDIELSTHEPSPSTKNSRDATSAAVLASRLDPNEDKRIMRNILIISFAFMCLFTAYQSMSNLQSSINDDHGVGTASLSTIYISLVISSIFLPTFLIKKFTAKWTLAVSMLCYCTYIAAQFYPTYYTLIPGAIILGFGAAPMWSAKCTYLTQAGNVYAAMHKVSAEAIIMRFFGIFFLLFQSSQVWGNLIASTVLSSGSPNVTYNPEALSTCGASFCNQEQMANNVTNENLKDPEKSKIYLLASIYLVLALCASAIVALFVDPLTRYGEYEREGSGSNLVGVRLLTATVKHLRKPYQLLIVPLTIFSGLEQGYISADFTQAYISCAWGIHHVGYVMICFGVSDAICSISFGFLVRYVGRLPLFVLGAVLNVVMIIFMLNWSPDPENAYIFFIITGVWGIADAVWQTQINSFYGVLFPANEEAAFSNYRLWESVGFIIAYIYSTLVCTYVKLYVLLGFLAVGMSGYATIEVLELRRKRKMKN